jgi:hypothetical protein
MQFDFPVLDPQVTTGTDLANYLNAWVQAAESSHQGAARPPYALPGMIWVQVVSAALWKVFLYTGTVDAQLATLDPTTGVFSFFVGGTPAASVDDATAYAIALG